jgi:GAF domain-containing protein
VTDVLAAVRDPQRLAALRRQVLLDTPPSETFDRLTRLAARVLDAPVALLTLVDEDRQFFKSSVGLPEPFASARQTPLEFSICQYAVAAKARLVVEDARTDPSLADHPIVRQFGVVAYAGDVLVFEGHAVGTLCVLDVRPRAWSEDELATLTDLAATTVEQIRLHRIERLLARRREAGGLPLTRFPV